MKKDDSCLLVITACVDPRSGPMQVVRSDPQLRLKDYKTALRFWLGTDDPRFQRILFLENSAYPMDELKSLVDRENRAGKQVEFISMDCNNYPPGLTYGYAELEMLDRGLLLSKLARPEDMLIKATGRLAAWVG